LEVEKEEDDDRSVGGGLHFLCLEDEDFLGGLEMLGKPHMMTVCEAKNRGMKEVSED
jgi:hypothetical protein